MPLYSYRCTECGSDFEARQRFSDEPIRDCPSCNGRVRRVIGPVGVVFKGTGFYVNDSRGGSSSGKSTLSSNGRKKEEEGSTTEVTATATETTGKGEPVKKEKESSTQTDKG